MKWPTAKNGCSGMSAVFGSALVIIMGAVPPDHLQDWRWEIVALAGISAILSVVQMFLGSNDDRELITKLNILISQRDPNTKQEVREERTTPGEIQDQKQAITGNLYRIAISPRTLAWPIIRDLFKMQGTPEKAVVDTDAVVEMYLVNQSDKDKYIREINLSAEISGARTPFMMQSDLRAKDVNDKKWEYALEGGKDLYAAEIIMKRLIPDGVLKLGPEESSEGWVRFMAKDINPDNINPNSWQCLVVDSVGNEYPINESKKRDDAPEVTLRKLR